MQKSILSDKVFVFVCYQSGSGGEKMSTQVSKFDNCNKLEFYTTPDDRTVITNELFNKVFLNMGWSLDKILESARQTLLTNENIGNKLHVVPSHWDYTHILPYFPNGKIVRIIHNNHNAITQLRDRKVFGGKFKTFLELKGYCLMYVTDGVFKKLLTEKRLNMEMTIGQIHEILVPVMNVMPEPGRNGDFTVQSCDARVFDVWHNTFESNKNSIADFILDK